MWSNISAPKSGLKTAQVGHQTTTSPTNLNQQENSNNIHDIKSSNSTSTVTTTTTASPISPRLQSAWPVVGGGGGSGSSPVMRYKHAVCSCLTTGHIYIHGGRFGNGLQLDDDVWRFDPHQNSWFQLTTSGCKPPSLQEHTLIEHAGQLYMFGGQVSAASGQENSFWRLDLATNLWWSLDMKSGMKYGAYLGPTNRRGHSACLYRDSMYIFGGYEDFRGSSSQLWQYDLLNERWELRNLSSTSACHPEPRHGHSAIVYNDSMYVYGGLSNLKPLGDLWRWSWKDKRWYRERTRGKCPGQLHGHTAIQAFGSMFVFGGERQNGRTTRSLWRLNLNNLCWQKVRPKGPRPNPMTWHVAIANPMNILDEANYLIEGADQVDDDDDAAAEQQVAHEMVLYSDELGASTGANSNGRSFSDNCFLQTTTAAAAAAAEPVTCRGREQSNDVTQQTIPMERSGVEQNYANKHQSASSASSSNCSQLRQRMFGQLAAAGQQAKIKNSSSNKQAARLSSQHTLIHSKSITSGEHQTFDSAAAAATTTTGSKGSKSKRKLRLNFLRTSKHKGPTAAAAADKQKASGGGGGGGGELIAGKQQLMPNSWSAASVLGGSNNARNPIDLPASNKRHSVTIAAQPAPCCNQDQDQDQDIEMAPINVDGNQPTAASMQQAQQLNAKNILDTLDTDIKQMFEQSALGPHADGCLGAQSTVKCEQDEEEAENRFAPSLPALLSSSTLLARQDNKMSSLNGEQAAMTRDSMTQSQLSSYAGCASSSSKMTSLSTLQTYQTAREQLTSQSTLTITNSNIACDTGSNRKLKEEALNTATSGTGGGGGGGHLGDIRQRRSMHQFNQAASCRRVSASGSNATTIGGERKARPKSEIVQSLIDRADARIKHLYTPLFQPTTHHHHHHHHNHNHQQHHQHTTNYVNRNTVQQQQQQQQQQQPFNSNDPILGHLQNHRMFERQPQPQQQQLPSSGQRSVNAIDKSKRHTIHQTMTYYNLYFGEDSLSGGGGGGNKRAFDLNEKGACRRPPPTSNSQQVISPRHTSEQHQQHQQRWGVLPLPLFRDDLTTTSASSTTTTTSTLIRNGGTLIGVRDGSTDTSSTTQRNNWRQQASGNSTASTTADASLSSSICAGSGAGLASSTRSDSQTLCANSERNVHQSGQYNCDNDNYDNNEDEYSNSNSSGSGSNDYDNGEENEDARHQRRGRRRRQQQQQQLDNQTADSELCADNTSLSFSIIAEFEEDDMLQYSSPTDSNLIIGQQHKESPAQMSDEFDDDQYDDEDDDDKRQSRADSRMQLDGGDDETDAIHLANGNSLNANDECGGGVGVSRMKQQQQQQQQQQLMLAQKSTSSGYDSIRSTSTPTGQESPNNNSNSNNYQASSISGGGGGGNRGGFHDHEDSSLRATISSSLDGPDDTDHHHHHHHHHQNQLTANTADNKQYSQHELTYKLPLTSSEAQGVTGSRNSNCKTAVSSATVDSLALTGASSQSNLNSTPTSNSNSTSIRMHSPPSKSLPLSSSSAEDELLMVHLRDNNRMLLGECRQMAGGRLNSTSCNRSHQASSASSRSITSRLFSSKKRTKTRYWQLCMFVIGGKQQAGAGSHASGGMLNEPINVWRLYI